MSLEKRIERLERRRPATEEQRIRTIFICPDKESSPTDEEIELAKVEFIKKYPEHSMMMIDFPKGITFTRYNGEYIELPHSDRLRQLRQKRIDSQDGAIPAKPFKGIA